MFLDRAGELAGKDALRWLEGADKFKGIAENYRSYQTCSMEKKMQKLRDYS